MQADANGEQEILKHLNQAIQPLSNALSPSLSQLASVLTWSEHMVYNAPPI